MLKEKEIENRLWKKIADDKQVSSEPKVRKDIPWEARLEKDLIRNF